jgi:hypothetical protein
MSDDAHFYLNGYVKEPNFNDQAGIEILAHGLWKELVLFEQKKLKFEIMMLVVNRMEFMQHVLDAVNFFVA